MKFAEWMGGVAEGISAHYSSVEAELKKCLPANLEVEAAVVDLRKDHDSRWISRSFLLLTANSLIHGDIRTPELPGAKPDELQVKLVFYPLNQIVAANQLTTFDEGTLDWSRDVNLTLSFVSAPDLTIPLRGRNPDPETLVAYRAIANVLLEKIV